MPGERGACVFESPGDGCRRKRIVDFLAAMKPSALLLISRPLVAPGLFLSISLTVLAQAQEVKQVEKAGHFRTLVNPPCSHCIDESKRRAGDLRDDDRVLAWIRGKYDGGAVPFRFFLVPYRVISDTYGVWVYDADAGFVRGFEPSLDFTFHGWRNGIMVIAHRDGTLFSALSGMGFEGPRQGTALKPVPVIETDWGYWSKQYPGTVAYHMFDKYVPHEMPAPPEAGSVATRPPEDDRLPPGEPVVGIALGDKARAYPISLLATEHVIRDRIGDEEVAVLWYAATKTAAIYAPRMEDESIPARLKLERKAQLATAPFMDKQTFSHWTIEGRAVAGPLKGKSLVWLPGVQCKWFAWAAEFPHTEVFSSPERKEESTEPMVARLIDGERLDWDKLVKTSGYVVTIDPSSGWLTVFADHDKTEHRLSLTSQTEYHVDGAWGSSSDFQSGQCVYLIATTNERKELVGVHALVNDLSVQAMSRPYVVKSFDPNEGHLVFSDESGRKGPAGLRVGRETVILTAGGADLKVGDVLYCNMRRTGSDRTVTELLDTPAFEARRDRRLRRQRESLAKSGLPGTVLDVDRENSRMEVIVRRSEAWYARSLRTNDGIGVRVRAGEKMSCQVAEVHPDYSRTRLRLQLSDSDALKANPGDGVALVTKLPDTVDFESPPDLGRFTDRQKRIDYMLSTIYCPCGMMGDSCAGHWNTLAACKLHGCGMPNLVSKLAGEWIDAGKSDADILAALVQRFGKGILTPRLN
jgi:Protein of unknown function (DUF3179)